MSSFTESPDSQDQNLAMKILGMVRGFRSRTGNELRPADMDAYRSAVQQLDVAGLLSLHVYFRQKIKESDDSQASIYYLVTDGVLFDAYIQKTTGNTSGSRGTGASELFPRSFWVDSTPSQVSRYFNDYQ
jgi:hypothetical protein